MLLGLVGAAKILLLLQATQSSVTGIVRDNESGAPLADAVVGLPDLDRSALSDSTGRYTFTAVPPGPQHLSVRRIGYLPRTLHALVPTEGALQIDLSLDPAPLRLPHLVVRSKLALRGLEDGDSTPIADRSVSIAELRNDPLLAEPDGLLGLSGGEVTAALETPSGLNIGGGASDQTRYLLDGVPVFSPYHAAGTFSAWNPDALERHELVAASSRAGFPDALAGTVVGVTRSPTSQAVVQGTMSTTQARVTVDGPIGTGGAGYLLSFRTGFPGLIAPKEEASYLSGQTHDLIVKGESPLLRGRLRLLFYEGGNGIGSTVQLEPSSERPVRNDFEWSSLSTGAQWSGRAGSLQVRLRAWSASSEAEATWIGSVPVTMTSERQDYGVLASLERSDSRSSTISGLKMEGSRTSYQADPLDGTRPALRERVETPLHSIFLQHERDLGAGTAANIAVTGTVGAGAFHASLYTQLRRQVSGPLLLWASYARAHQFSQSLRNPESVVGNIFPADLYLGSGSGRIPVAREHRAVFAADYRPAANLRIGAQLYGSRSDDLLLVAPHTPDPFATTGYTTGSGTAAGFSLDAALSATRYGLVARYGWQRVRLRHADSTYTPSSATGHLGELGAILFPTATTSIRLGLTGAIGRRATAVTGPFEWESCNLLDRGCEFGGSPQASDALGATRLPSYLRLDLGLRKHWHLNLGRRDLTLGVFGTLTNLLGRTNVLTVATDPVTGRTSIIEMRPRAPLVVGVDCRF